MMNITHPKSFNINAIEDMNFNGFNNFSVLKNQISMRFYVKFIRMNESKD